MVQNYLCVIMRQHTQQMSQRTHDDVTSVCWQYEIVGVVWTCDIYQLLRRCLLRYATVVMLQQLRAAVN